MIPTDTEQEKEAAKAIMNLSNIYADRLQRFTTIAFSIFYVTFFALWSFSKDLLKEDTLFMSGFSMSISVLCFGIYVIFIILEMDLAAGRFNNAVSKNPDSSLAKLTYLIQKENEYYSATKTKYILTFMTINKWIGIAACISAIIIMIASFYSGI